MRKKKPLLAPETDAEKREVMAALEAASVGATPHPYTPTGLWIPLHNREAARKVIERFPGWIVDHRGQAFKVPVK